MCTRAAVLVQAEDHMKAAVRLPSLFGARGIVDDDITFAAFILSRLGTSVPLWRNKMMSSFRRVAAAFADVGKLICDLRDAGVQRAAAKNRRSL